MGRQHLLDEFLLNRTIIKQAEPTSSLTQHSVALVFVCSEVSLKTRTHGMSARSAIMLVSLEEWCGGEGDEVVSRVEEVREGLVRGEINHSNALISVSQRKDDV